MTGAASCESLTEWEDEESAMVIWADEDNGSNKLNVISFHDHLMSVNSD